MANFIILNPNRTHLNPSNYSGFFLLNQISVENDKLDGLQFEVLLKPTLFLS